MKLNLKAGSLYSIFHPDENNFGSAGISKFILVSDYDGWNHERRNREGLTGVHHDGAPRTFASEEEAVNAAHQVIAAGNQYITGVYKCGSSITKGQLVNDLRPEVKDIVEGYSDAGSW